MPDQEVRERIEKMIDACVQFTKGKMTFTQLWYRCRGDKNNIAIQKFKGGRLGYLLFQLYMDFICWKDYRDDIIKKSAAQIVKWIEDNKAGSA